MNQRRREHPLVGLGRELAGTVLGAAVGATVYLLGSWFWDNPPASFSGAISFGLLALVALALIAVPISLTLILARGFMARSPIGRHKIALPTIILFLLGSLMGYLFRLLIPGREVAEFQMALASSLIFLGGMCGMLVSPWLRKLNKVSEKRS